MRKKTARVVKHRPADVDEFLRILTIHVWTCVSTFFSETQSRHCVAVTIMDRKKIQTIFPTPQIIGTITDFAEEYKRLISSTEKCIRLLAHPECFTSSQAGERGGAIRIGDRVIGITGLGERMDEAIGLVTVTAQQTLWDVSEGEWMGVAYQSGSGPNTLIPKLRELFGQLPEYLANRGLTFDTFTPDFENLGTFKST